MSTAPPSPASVAPGNSIVVLPFRNLSGQAEEEYVADAITDDITTDLSRLRQATVIASASALTYKNRPFDVRQIGRELGARFALEGSVKRVGRAVQVNAQLIDTQSGTHLWANRFTHEGTSLLALQEAITGRIAATLNVQLAQVQRRHEVGTLAADGNPLNERMRAMAIMAEPSFTPAKSLEAREHIERALGVYPQSAELQATLGNLLIGDVLNSWNGAGQAEVYRAVQAIDQALRLDPSEPIAHYARGMVLRVRGDHAGALAAYQEAARRRPNLARAHAQIANQLVFLGRPKEEVIAAAQEAIRLSPRDPSIGVFYWVIGRAHFVGGQLDDAIESLKKSVEERDNVWFNEAWRMAALALRGRIDEAQALVPGFTRRFPDHTLQRIDEIYNGRDNVQYRALSQEARNNLIRGLRTAGLP